MTSRTRQTTTGSELPVPSRPKSVSESTAPSALERLVPQRFDARASIVLIGLHGVGKRSLGFIAAVHLKRRFCSEHRCFEEDTGVTKTAFLRRHGYSAFVQRRLEVFRRMLICNSSDCVIECGTIDLPRSGCDALAAYALTHPVIHVLRDFDELIRHLRLPTLDVERMQRADADHRACSSVEFYNLFDPSCRHEQEIAAGVLQPTSPLTLQNAKIDFCNFVDLILNIRSAEHEDPFCIPRLPGSDTRRSFTTVWRLSALSNGALSVKDEPNGEDAIELLIDYWHDGTAEEVSKHVAGIRRHQNTAIIYSLDVHAPGVDKRLYLTGLAHGLRLGVDYVVVNSLLPEPLQQWVLSNRGYTTLIFHRDFDPVPPRAWTQPSRCFERTRAKELGYDIVRMTQTAEDKTDNADVRRFHDDAIRRHPSSIPLIAYNTGQLGRSSKIHNTILTPVLPCSNVNVHQDSSTLKRQDGEVTIKDINQALVSSFEYDPLHFYVLGSSISFTRSPAIHDAAFQLYGLPHDLQYCDINSFDDARRLTHDHSFGGAAISFPFKELALDACATVTAHASAIGSVNTIVALRQLATAEETRDLCQQANQRNKAGAVAGLHGDNSDWLGFYRNIRRKLSPRNAVLNARSTALVLGAGGSARSAIYALIQIGYYNVYVRNRTEQKAIRLAEHFNQWCERNRPASHRSQVYVLPLCHGKGQQQWPEGVDLPTVIIACVPSADADFDCLETWLAGPTGGVAADVSETESLSIEA